MCRRAVCKTYILLAMLNPNLPQEQPLLITCDRLSWYVLVKLLHVNQKYLLCRCAVCKTHICWLCGVKICQGINNYWDANRHFWIKGTPCYGQIQAIVK